MAEVVRRMASIKEKGIRYTNSTPLAMAPVSRQPVQLQAFQAQNEHYLFTQHRRSMQELQQHKTSEWRSDNPDQAASPAPLISFEQDSGAKMKKNMALRRSTLHEDNAKKWQGIQSEKLGKAASNSLKGIE